MGTSGLGVRNNVSGKDEVQSVHLKGLPTIALGPQRGKTSVSSRRS